MPKSEMSRLDTALVNASAAYAVAQAGVMMMQTMMSGLVQRGVFREADIVSMFRSLKFDISGNKEIPESLRGQMGGLVEQAEKIMLGHAARFTEAAGKT